MNAIAGELVELEQFFAPASTDMIDTLIGQYRQDRERIERVAGLMATELGTTVQYFAEGNEQRERWYGLDRLFQLDGAVAALNSSYWNRTLRLTDVIDCMPQKRRDEWFEQIREHKAPDFEETVVRDTIGRLVAILPASAKGKDLLPGWQCEWSQVFDNEFAGTSVSVVILAGTNE